MRKKNIDQSGEMGSLVMASGYAVKAIPGPGNIPGPR